MDEKQTHLSQEALLQRLAHPAGKIKVILDTDTYNEIDDQFALTYMMLSQDKFDVQAIYAAPFFNENFTGHKDGMEKSYAEILKVLDKIGIGKKELVFKGSERIFKSENEPVMSPAAENLIKQADALGEGESIYVIAIGAITNIASAIRIRPDIIDKIVICWLAGNAFHWNHTKEFNMMGDIIASQIIFDSTVPLVFFPCGGVVTHLTTTVAELEKYAKDKGRIGRYLFDIMKEATGDVTGRSRVIWDMAPVAWLLNDSWAWTNIVNRPIINDNLTFSHDFDRPFMRYCHHICRDEIFADLFNKLFLNIPK